ncbi:hypothetical protein [Chakrabartyella piscis]|uniref:hypothetical protein n=1 Tax=Chakrabartyella piscis TaxID=2918914 RepID=UPI002958D23D|nr:hypothetical protein [Chakrabartyella piscis]
MGVQEYILRLMVALQPMLVCIIAVVIITCLCLPILVVKSRGLWFDKANFKFLSLFYKMSFYDCVRLASASVRCIMVVVFVIQFAKLQAIHLVCFGMVAVLYAFDKREMTRTLSNIIWIVVQLVSLLSLNVVCGYILDMSTGVAFVAVYVVLGIFVTLFAIYLFITEINEVSMGRRARIEINGN